MSLQQRFYQAFSNLRARLRESHPQVRDVTYEIPRHPGATLRVQVGVVMAGYGKEAYRVAAWEIEQAIQECLQEESLPFPTEIFFATPEELGGDTAYRHFFGKVAK
jgi:hypothetical protein